MHHFKKKALAAAIVTLASAVVAGAAFAAAPGAALQDLGALSAQERAAPLTVTVALKLRDADRAEALVEQIYTPGGAQYRRFLTPAQFRERFAPTAAQREQVAARLRGFGLTVDTATTSSTLKVSGPAAALERAFQVSLHRYAAPAHGERPASTFRAPANAPVVPADIAPLVHAVFGLDGHPAWRGHHRQALASRVDTLAANAGGAHPLAAGALNAAGHWTVADFAGYYGVAPLYAQGIQGQGQTVGIVTFAGFTDSDAFSYWTAAGLSVASDRLSRVDVDGGPGAPSDASGSDETTLDIEQAGGVAPAASVVVYEAPNTDQGFVDAFAAAIDANVAETLSTSWGDWEWLSTHANGGVINPVSGRDQGSARVMHVLLLQAALQGQTVIAAAGDAGAYDADEGNYHGHAVLPPDFSLALSIDAPGDDPYITSAGGTTLAGTQTFTLGDGVPPVVIDIPQERVWGWDYLQPLCDALGQDAITCGIVPVGGGGGVSVMFPRPFFQRGLDGFQASQPGQAMVDNLTTPPTTVYTFPAGFVGRNVPDISANADPETGYTLVYTSDRHGLGTSNYGGGTSFVAPQLNGVAALLAQSLHGRVGLLNASLYEVARHHGYKGAAAPLRAIAQGGNEFYVGSDGYNPAAGLGVLNAASLAEAMKKLVGN